MINDHNDDDDDYNNTTTNHNNNETNNKMKKNNDNNDDDNNDIGIVESSNTLNRILRNKIHIQKCKMTPCHALLIFFRDQREL